MSKLVDNTEWWWNKRSTVIIMRGQPKQVYYKSWKQVSQAAQALAAEPYRFLPQLKAIVASAFGTDTQPGLIIPRLPYYYQKAPIHWAEEIQLIISIFSPGQPLFSSSLGLMACADYKVEINSRLLPRQVAEDFQRKQGSNQTLLKNLKKSIEDKNQISLWEWFWIHAIQALLNSPEIEQTRSLAEDYQQDELFYLISRNPLLMIVHKTLTFNSFRASQRQLLQRLVQVIQVYVIEEMINSFQSRGQNRYQLKSHNIALIVLLINSRRQGVGKEGLKLYYQFFHRAAEHFEKLTAQTKNPNILRNLIRAWTSFLTRQSGIEYQLINQLQFANPSNGCYRIERCPQDRWFEAVKDIGLDSNERASIMLPRKQIYRLLKKHSDWRPSFSFLVVLEQFAQFDKTVLSKFPIVVESKEESETLNRCFERILTHLTEAGADCNVLQEVQNRLNLKYETVWRRKILIDFAEISQEVRQKIPQAIGEENRSISFQNAVMKSVWEHPRQDNQYQILLRGAKWAAQQLDRLIPGYETRTQPYLNLRIFANPYIFILSLLLLTLLMRSYLSKD